MDLFSAQTNQELNLRQLGNMEGSRLISGFIAAREASLLIEVIDRQNWSQTLKRRVQHYGYSYDYKSRSLTRSNYIGPLPDWLFDLAGRLATNMIIGFVPDQAIINEYLPGQGIALHTDCETCFEDTIVSISLGTQAVMDFQSRLKASEKIQVLLEPQSLIVLKGPARYDWLHGIAARKSDSFNGETFLRGRRLSITFRKVSL